MLSRSRLLVFVTILVAAGLISYGVFRSRSFQQQRLNGHPVSGISPDTDLRSATVLSIGEAYVSFDSTTHDSALWLARPAETLRSWVLPPPVAPFHFEPLVRWNDS